MFKNTLGGSIFLIILLMGCFLILEDAFDGEKGTFKLPLGIDLRGGTELQYKLDLSKIPRALHKEIAENVKTIMLRRLDQFGTSERSISTIGRDRLLVQLPGFDSDEIDTVKDAIEQAGHLSFNLVALDQDPSQIPELEEKMREYDAAARAFALAEDPNATPPTAPEKMVVGELGEDGKEIPGRKVIIDTGEGSTVEGKYLTSARRTTDPNGLAAIGFEFANRGKRQFADITGANKNRQLAIVLDGVIISDPVINERIAGPGIIQGIPEKGIKRIVTILNAGSLPTNPILESENSVGPGLGRESVSQGQVAMAASFGLVIIFMIGFYLAPGMVANMALILNLIILLTAMVIFRNTLTFPGMAGLLLTVGMAVDANILIFERIREEKSRGKSLNQAVTSGYQRAFWTIFDANLTTLLTAFILFHLGTGPVKGFAIVLSIGIMASFFTAVYVSRLIISILMKYKLVTELRMLQLIKNPSIDFLSLRKPAMMASVSIIVVGLVVLFIRGNENLGIDFTGGTRLVVNLDEPVEPKAVRDAIQSITENGRPLYEDVQVQQVGEVAEGGALAVSILTRNFEEVQASAQESEDDDAPRAQATSQDRFKNNVRDKLEEKGWLAPVGFGATAEETAADGTKRLAKKVNFHRQGSKPTLADVETALKDAGVDYDRVELAPGMGADSPFVGVVISRPAEGMTLGARNEWDTSLATALKDRPDLEISEPFQKADVIGGKVAADLQNDAFFALLVAIAAIVFYISLRFQFKFGLAAVVALLHDILFVVAVMAIADALLGGFISLKLNLPVVAALLTVVGYSLNDTIVIFDRIRENVTGKKRGFDYIGTVNQSINQTLARTLLTSATTFVVVFILLVGGGEGIMAFAFALCVGVIVGTFSSIYIASPALIHFNERSERRRLQIIKEAGGK